MSTTFNPDATYRVTGIGLAGHRGDDVIGFFASPHHGLAANGFKVTRDGNDMILSGAALEYLAATMTPDDDGSIADGSLWACGDPHVITETTGEEVSHEPIA
jgi:hypothetical protein